MKFIRNTGQYHPKVAWVATVAEPIVDQYHGSGMVSVLVDETGTPISMSYEPATITEPTAGLYRISAMASCWELVVEAGTKDAAVLNALAAKNGGTE